MNSIQARDSFQLEQVINEAGIVAVDPDIDLCKANNIDLQIAVDNQAAPFIYGSDKHVEELQFLHMLSDMRDERLEDCDNNSCDAGYRVPSWFLRNVTVDKYQTGKNYQTEDSTFQVVQRGDRALETQELESDTQTAIITGRDAAAFVKSDNPLITWMSVVDDLLRIDVNHRVESGMVYRASHKRFASCGVVYIYALLGEALKRLSPISFREKWTQLVPRPEETSLDITGKYLSQTYNTGSPYHPSRNAMHFIAAAVLAEIILMIFDRYAVLPSGKTVEDEVELLRDNVGYWRCWAGVHYPSDNSEYLDRARALARQIISERYDGNIQTCSS